MPKMSMHLNPSPSPGWFFGPECQRSAWPTHKLSCGKDSKASKDLESAKLEPTSSEKTLDSKLRCVFHVFFIPKDWLHLGILWYGCDIEYKLPWCNDSETWLSWLLLGPQNLNDHNFRENQQSPINLGVNSVALRWFRFLNPIGLLQPILGLIKQTHISTRGRKKKHSLHDLWILYGQFPVLSFNRQQPVSPLHRVNSRYVWGSESDHLLWSSPVADADLRKVGELSASKAWGCGGCF